MSIPILLPNSAGLRRAADVIRQGGLIAYPTETVYGLGVDPFNAEALDRLFAVKGRDTDRSVILLIRGDDDLGRLTSPLAPQAERISRALMDAFWPGPITLIFPAADLPSALSSSKNTIALRQTGSLLASKLLAELKGPITSTSANRSGDPPARSAGDVAATFSHDLDLILDGGPLTDTAPSTVIDITTDRPTILRNGPISPDDIQNVIQQA